MAVKLSTIKPNPDNPRTIKDEKFKKLIQSIRDFPQMMELRPIVVDENNITLGGNMRYRALIEAGYKEIPNSWVKKKSGLSDDQKKEFIVKDNVGFGEWDWETLANEWDTDQLDKWGLDIPNFKTIEDEEEKQPGDSAQWFLNIRCASEKECQTMYEKFISQGLDVKIVT